MTSNYTPHIEENDDGYSIPKILVAVLLLALIGAGIYIYYQKRKLKNSVIYLIEEKKQTEKDLNEIIEKYNLAIDDNEDLEGNLIKERDFVIRYRDSIKKIQNEDQKKITDYQKKISELKKTSSIELNKSVQSVVPSVQPVSIKKTLIDNEEDNTSKQSLSNDQESLKDTTSKDPGTLEESITESATTAFNRVEIPPIYPGCNKGSPSQKKACFTKKIKRHLNRRYDTSLINDLNLSSGKKRIWINFDIDKSGNVTNIKARAPKDIPFAAKKSLESEAIRVIKKMPKIIAAQQNGKAVNIRYSIPLTLIVP